ncbi:hypothetical protein LTR17_020442 [Elasticomyces elasticus]|nr:hypothetical protein LTR17_020442 [Elasticomyces elasticus]
MSSSSGLNAHIFRPPLTPSTTSSNPTSTDYFSSRKRPRQPTWTRTEDVRSTLHQTPGWQLASQSQSQCPTPGYNHSINERYTLAGGLDTPGLLAQTESEQGDTYNDGRTRRRDDSAAAAFDGRANIVTGPLARERNGVARVPHLPASSSPNGEAGRSWTGLAFGLVGKVFSFGTSVVKGFYAGGGTGYDLSLNLKDSPLRGILMNREAIGTPVPGSWQEDGEFLGDFEQDNTATVGSGQRPGNKRRQTGEGSWVMVGTPDLEGEVEGQTSPRRKGAGSSTRIARPSASRASSRRSLAPLPRRQSSYMNAGAGAGAGYASGSPAAAAQQVVGGHERRASVAPVRTHSRAGSLSNTHTNLNSSRPSSAAGNPPYSTSTLHSRPPTSTLSSHHSPRNSVHLANGSNRLSGISSPGMVYVSPEAEKILRRREKHERKADAAMSDMSRKLGDLIREGREALGTRVDVEGDDGDGW